MGSLVLQGSLRKGKRGTGKNISYWDFMTAILIGYDLCQLSHCNHHFLMVWKKNDTSLQLKHPSCTPREEICNVRLVVCILQMGNSSLKWSPEIPGLQNLLFFSNSSTSREKDFGELWPFMMASNRKARICTPPHRHGAGILPASGPGPPARQRTFTVWSDIRGTSGQRTRAMRQVFLTKVQRKPTSKIGKSLTGWSGRTVRKEQRTKEKEGA